jgi:hypothetical protein
VKSPLGPRRTLDLAGVWPRPTPDSESTRPGFWGSGVGRRRGLRSGLVVTSLSLSECELTARAGHRVIVNYQTGTPRGVASAWVEKGAEDATPGSRDRALIPVPGRARGFRPFPGRQCQPGGRSCRAAVAAPPAARSCHGTDAAARREVRGSSRAQCEHWQVRL